jgi:hypothetical protein
MTPKKTAKVQPQYEEEVIPAAATVTITKDDSEGFEATIVNNTDEPVPFPSIHTSPRGVYVAYAPFDFDGEHYEAGDEFTPRKSWLRDTAFEEFRSVELKRGGAVGIAFLVPGEVIDKKTGDRAQSRQILPVKEA